MTTRPFGGAGKVGQSLLSGPEKRLVFIAVNAFIILTGTRTYAITLPAVTAVVLIALVVSVVHTHRRLWALDMAVKAAEAGATAPGGDPGATGAKT